MSRTLQELREQARLNYELWTGDFQNRGTVAMTMLASATAQHVRRGNKAGFQQTSVGTGCITSNAVVGSVVDLTGTITIEFSMQQNVAATDRVLVWVDGATTGLIVQMQGSTTGFIYLFNAGVVARTVNANSIPIVANDHFHMIMQSTNGGTGGAAWINGVPSLIALAGAGAAANPAACLVGAAGGNAGLAWFGVIRLWQGALDAAEVNTLYSAYQGMVVNARV